MMKKWLPWLLMLCFAGSLGATIMATAAPVAITSASPATPAAMQWED